MYQLKIALLLFFSFLAFASNPAFAQEGHKMANATYLLPEFNPATILFKSGSTKEAVFNYNTVTEEMVYQKDGTFMALEMPGIDTIYLAGRKFIPFDKAFFEVVTSLPAILFIRHHKELVPKGKPVGYGGYSQTAATTSLNSLVTSGTIYKLETPSDYNLKDVSSFWIRKNGQFHETNSRRQVEKAFPERRADIKAFVKEHDTNFYKPEDVMALLRLIYQE